MPPVSIGADVAARVLEEMFEEWVRDADEADEADEADKGTEDTTPSGSLPTMKQ
jgi:hypothetical protein